MSSGARRMTTKIIGLHFISYNFYITSVSGLPLFVGVALYLTVVRASLRIVKYVVRGHKKLCQPEGDSKVFHREGHSKRLQFIVLFEKAN